MGVFKIKYSPLFYLQVVQPYYLNKVCKAYQTQPQPDFSLIPTPACVGTMKRLGYIFKQDDRNGGCTVFAEVSGQNMANQDLLRFHPKALDKLVFWMVLKNPSTTQFNDLPVALPNNYLYYFDNLVADGAAVRSALHISKDVATVKGANDAMESSYSAYSYVNAGNITPADAEVKHLVSGQTVAPKNVVNQGTQAFINFDLSTLPSGVCQLLILGVPTDTFYYIGNVAPQPIFGAVEIMLQSSVAQHYEVIENDFSLTPDRPIFTIPFKSRKTHWRYTVQLAPTSALALEIASKVGPAKTDFLNHINILCNDPSITFAAGTSTEVRLVFESSNAPDLQEQYFHALGMGKEPLSLSLYKNTTGPGTGTVVKSSLPYPSPDMVNASEPPFIYSDIFLTI